MAPAVVHETIQKNRVDDVTTVIDKEIHQDHYHTTVQPIQDVNILPEKHVQELAAVQERSFDAGNDAEVRARIEQERSKFKDMTIEGEQTRTTQMSPTVVAEHTTHHLHETIQPIVNRATVDTTVVHTTVPIHEIHHSAAAVHSASSLPPISMEQFKSQGGSIDGRPVVSEKFAGVPTGFDTNSGDSGAGLVGSTGTSSAFTGNNTTSSRTGGLSGTSSPTSAGGLTGNRTTGSGLMGSRSEYDNTTSSSTTGLTGNSSSSTGLTGNSSSTSTGLTGNTTSSHTTGKGFSS